MGTAGRPRISVIVATCDRPTLARAVRSSRWADEVVVVFDAAAVPRHLRGCVTAAVGPVGAYGGPQRNHGIELATGTHLAFMDDDDVYTRGAGRAIRAAVEEEPARVHVFRMRNRDKVYAGPVVSGAIGTPMFVVPREPVGRFTERYGDDLDFITETLALRGDEPLYHEAIVASVRPPTPFRMLSALWDPPRLRRVARRALRRLSRRRPRRPQSSRRAGRRRRR